MEFQSSCTRHVALQYIAVVSEHRLAVECIDVKQPADRQGADVFRTLVHRSGRDTVEFPLHGHQRMAEARNFSGSNAGHPSCGPDHRCNRGVAGVEDHEQVTVKRSADLE